MTFPHKGYYIHINLLFEQKTNIFLNNYCYNHKYNSSLKIRQA